MRQTILDLSDAQAMLDQLLEHWGQSNRQSAAGPIMLRQNYDRESFLSDIVRFEQLSLDITNAIVRRDEASERLVLYKSNMRNTLQKFGHLVRGLFPDTEFADSVPALSDVRSNEPKFIAPIERATALWQKINVAQPLILPGGVDLSSFEKGVAALKQAFKARDRAFAVERAARESRRKLHQTLVSRAVQYRSVVLGLFGEDSLPAQTMPYLWPRQDRSKKQRHPLSPVVERVQTFDAPVREYATR